MLLHSPQTANPWLERKNGCNLMKQILSPKFGVCGKTEMLAKWRQFHANTRHNQRRLAAFAETDCLRQEWERRRGLRSR